MLYAHLFIMAGSSWWGPYAYGTPAKGALERPVPAVHFRHPSGDSFRGGLRLSGRQPRRALGGVVPGDDPERCSEQEEGALVVGAFGEETGRLLGEMSQEQSEYTERGGGI